MALCGAVEVGRGSGHERQDEGPVSTPNGQHHDAEAKEPPAWRQVDLVINISPSAWF